MAGDWLGAVRAEVSPKTHERYSQIVEQYLVPKLGNLLLAKLAPANIQVAYNELGIESRREAGKPVASDSQDKASI